MSRNLWPLAGFLLMVGLSAGGLSSDSPKLPAPFIDKHIPVFGPAALTMYRDSRASMEDDAYRVPEKLAVGIGSVHRRDQVRPLTRVALEKDLLPLIQTMQRWYAGAILTLVALTAVAGMWAARADGATFASRMTAPDSPSSRLLDGFQRIRDSVDTRLPEALQRPSRSLRQSQPFPHCLGRWLYTQPSNQTDSLAHARSPQGGRLDRPNFCRQLADGRPSVGSHG